MPDERHALDERARRAHHPVEPPAVVVSPRVRGRERAALVVVRAAVRRASPGPGRRASEPRRRALASRAPRPRPGAARSRRAKAAAPPAVRRTAPGRPEHPRLHRRIGPARPVSLECELCQALDEQDARLAGPVVGVVDALDLEAERLVERDGALVDRRGDGAHDRARRDRGEEALVERRGRAPSRACAGSTPTKWMYASSAKVCERKPQRKPASAPSSSATNDVSRKWTKKSFGSIAAIGRPPHHSSTTATTRP